MGENSNISWTDSTFNPWVGCSKVSPGCANCYAEELMDTRYKRVKWGKGQPRSRTSASNWKEPLRWNRKFDSDMDRREEALAIAPPGSRLPPKPSRPRVFCASLADWLDEEVPIEWLADLLKLIYDTPNLDWLLLTKRPQNFSTRISQAYEGNRGMNFSWMLRSWLQSFCGEEGAQPPQNVWLGTTVEDQQRANERIPKLLEIPANFRFLSMEPLLGPVDIDGTAGSHDGRGLCWNIAGKPTHIPHCDYKAKGIKPPDGPKIDWIIVGGESGASARHFNIDWARDIIMDCRRLKIAPFVKQLGAEPRQYVIGGESEALKLRDKKGGDMAEWPDDLRIQEFPKATP